MGDLENLFELKRLLEHKEEEDAKTTQAKERRFLSDATKAMLADNPLVTGIQVYEPEKMLEFLNQPSETLQKCMGGEWNEMTKESFESFTYVMIQKVRKSTTLMNWTP